MKFRIKTPSRIHMSLIDLNGSLRRIDGGFGMALDWPNVVIGFEDIPQGGIKFEGDANHKELVDNLVKRFCENYQVEIPNVRIVVEKTIPEHIGLGSKTQFLLAIARGLGKICGIKYEISEMANLVKRGGTSGIGYMAFDRGKFIVDLGHSYGKQKEKETFLPSSASPAPPAMPLVQIRTPELWRVLLVSLNVKQGANNEQEINIFQDRCPVSRRDVEKIAHRVLMQLIPAIKKGDLKQMAKSIYFFNNHGFKKIELELQHDYVRHVVNHLYKKYQVPAGMSSFGPIVYGIFETEEIAQEAAEEMRKKLESDLDSTCGEVFLVTPNNKGHQIF